MKGRQIRQKMHLLSLEGYRFFNLFFLYEKGGDEPGSADPKGTNLRVNALFRHECAPSFRNLPTIMIYWDNFPGSTVPYIKALMWRAKCPIKAWRCPFAHLCVFSL